MTHYDDFDAALTPAERHVVASLTTPPRIQAFLDSITYSSDDRYRCPLNVLRDRRGHCYDGALFAAAMLRRQGHPPRIVDLLPNARDDDHMLALYREGQYWGAVAKSNYTGLRFREPVYRSLRELVMSYFEAYFNVAREKTLRAYTVPLNLAAFDRLGWLTDDGPMGAIAERLDQIRKAPVITPEQAERLSPVDERTFQGALVGVNEAGLFRMPE